MVAIGERRFTKISFSAPLEPIPTLCQNFMEISSLVSEKNGNKHTDRQTNRHTNIGFTNKTKGFSTPLGPIPTLCQNFMEICSLVSEKNGNKHKDRQTNRHTNIGFTKKKFQCTFGTNTYLVSRFHGDIFTSF